MRNSIFIFIESAQYALYDEKHLSSHPLTGDIKLTKKLIIVLIKKQCKKNEMCYNNFW